MAYDALRTIMPIAGWPEERAHEVEISVGADPVLPRVQVRGIWVDRCVTEQGGVERTCVGHGVPSDLVVDFKTMFDTRRRVDRGQTTVTAWAANDVRRSQVGRRHAAGGSEALVPRRHRHAQARPKEVFETNAGFIERKGAMYPLSLSVRPGRQPEGERIDPNCTVPDCRVSVGPLGLHKPL
jgi:hypothetical protein